MRRMLGLIVISAALAGGSAFAQQDEQAQNDAKDQAQREQQLQWEQHRTDGPGGEAYRQKAVEARQSADRAKTPAEKTKLLKLAALYEQMAAQSPR